MINMLAGKQYCHIITILILVIPSIATSQPLTFEEVEFAFTINENDSLITEDYRPLFLPGETTPSFIKVVSGDIFWIKDADPSPENIRWELEIEHDQLPDEYEFTFWLEQDTLFFAGYNVGDFEERQLIAYQRIFGENLEYSIIPESQLTGSDIIQSNSRYPIIATYIDLDDDGDRDWFIVYNEGVQYKKVYYENERWDADDLVIVLENTNTLTYMTENFGVIYNSDIATYDILYTAWYASSTCLRRQRKLRGLTDISSNNPGSGSYYQLNTSLGYVQRDENRNEYLAMSQFGVVYLHLDGIHSYVDQLFACTDGNRMIAFTTGELTGEIEKIYCTEDYTNTILPYSDNEKYTRVLEFTRDIAGESYTYTNLLGTFPGDIAIQLSEQQYYDEVIKIAVIQSGVHNPQFNRAFNNACLLSLNTDNEYEELIQFSYVSGGSIKPPILGNLNNYAGFEIASTQDGYLRVISTDSGDSLSSYIIPVGCNQSGRGFGGMGDWDGNGTIDIFFNNILQWNPSPDSAIVDSFYTDIVFTEEQVNEYFGGYWGENRSIIDYNNDGRPDFYLPTRNLVLENTTITEVEESSQGKTPSTFAILNIYPNPFNNSLNVVYQLDSAENIYLNLYNLLGQKVLSSSYINQNIGKHTINLNGENLSSGNYYLQLKTDKNIAVRKVIQLK